MEQEKFTEILLVKEDSFAVEDPNFLKIMTQRRDQMDEREQDFFDCDLCLDLWPSLGMEEILYMKGQYYSEPELTKMANENVSVGLQGEAEFPVTRDGESHSNGSDVEFGSNQSEGRLNNIDKTKKEIPGFFSRCITLDSALRGEKPSETCINAQTNIGYPRLNLVLPIGDIGEDSEPIFKDIQISPIRNLETSFEEEKELDHESQLEEVMEERDSLVYQQPWA